MINIEKINKEQESAILHKEGPLLIIAGPGTGKTAVITKRIANLISKNKVLPEEILALTFTEKAAKEMKDRVEFLLPLDYQYSDFQISTFHSFCEKILRRHCLSAGITDDFNIIDEISSLVLIKKNIDNLGLKKYKPLSNPSKYIKPIIAYFSRCKDENIDYKKYEKLTRNNKELKEISVAYKKYQEILEKNNFLDFGDLILKTTDLFRLNPEVLKIYRKKIKYILVDEFQDTNKSQYLLLKMLSRYKKNIMVCADSNQAIYQWRGASNFNIKNFEKDFPKTKKISLIKNYRSLPGIINISNKFILLNKPDLFKEIKSTRKGNSIIQHLHFKNFDQEMWGISNKILELKKGKIKFSDFAILTRTNNDADLIFKAIKRNNIPSFFVSVKGLYQKDIIIDVISYFKILKDRKDDTAMYRVISSPFIGINEDDVLEITNYSYKKIDPIYFTLKKIESLGGVSKKTETKIKIILENIKNHTKISFRKSVSDLFTLFLKDFRYLEKISDDQESIDALNIFFDRIKKFENHNNFGLLRDFLEEILLEIDSGSLGSFVPELNNDCVKIMTIHSCKGLEFKYVFIANLVHRKFPVIEKRSFIDFPINKNINNQINEERNLFYVAITRAIDGLFFTSADNYGGIQDRKISRFVSELNLNDKLSKK